MSLDRHTMGVLGPALLSDESPTTLYRTRNSVYEVDDASKRARRVEGPDESLREWRAFDEAFLIPTLRGKQALAIYWTGAESGDPFVQDVTFTSPVQSVEPSPPFGEDLASIAEGDSPRSEPALPLEV